MLLACLVGCSHPAQQSTVDRLYDHAGGSFSLIADDTWRPTLDSSVDEQRFSIADAQRGSRLLFFPGIATSAPPGRVRFEITWQSGSEQPRTIYEQTLSEPGWAEGVVDVPATGPGELVLRKSARAGLRKLLSRAGWGDPTLLSGSSPARPSVILISLDTLRADRLGIYGRREARTPALDAFLRDAVRYDDAHSPSTWTMPSHQAMLSGVQAAAVPGSKLSMVPNDFSQWQGFESLAEAFRNAGYLTAAFTGGGYVSRLWGMGNGFDSFYEYSAPPTEPGTCSETRFDGVHVFGRAKRWLRARTGAPFFLFVHTYEAHDGCPVHPLPRMRAEDFTPEQRDAVIRYYDDVVARADALVGDLLRELDALGLADSTLIAITSDHGEALWEHGYWAHGCTIPAFDEVSHVPLALRLPHAARRGERIAAPVSTVDVAPTLLALTGIPVPGSMQGGTLPGLGLPSDEDRPVYVFCGEWLSVRKGDFKYILSRKQRQRMLFNVKNDRDERVDLVKKRGQAKDELRALAKSYWPRRQPVEQVETASQPAQALDPAVAERLRVLGYTE